VYTVECKGTTTQYKYPYEQLATAWRQVSAVKCVKPLQSAAYMFSIQIGPKGTHVRVLDPPMRGNDTGPGEWVYRVQDGERFQDAAARAARARSLSYAGDIPAAWRYVNLAEPDDIELSPPSPPPERIENELGAFRGQLQVFEYNEWTLSVFRGLNQQLYGLYIGDLRRESQRAAVGQLGLFHLSLENGDRPGEFSHATKIDDAGHSMEMQSVAPDGTTFMIRLVRR
jgi:hypothetical protein